MAKSAPAPPTALQVAHHGNVTAAIRQALARQEMTPAELRDKLGLGKDSTRIYPWIRGQSAPPVEWHARLAKALGIPRDALVPQAGKPSTALVPVSAKPPARKVPMPEGMQLSIRLKAGGQSQLFVDMEIPTPQALAIFRMLTEPSEAP